MVLCPTLQSVLAGFFLWGFLLNSAAFAEVARIASSYEVLVLHSYHPEYQWTDTISRGLRSSLESTGATYNLDYFYMDTKRIHDASYLRNIFELLQTKYQERARIFDAVVAVDNDALNFMKTFGDRLFPQVPVVFCGINNFSDDQLSQLSGYTGVAETISPVETLQMALRLHPDTESIWVIHDRTTTGLAVRRQLETDLTRLKDRVKVHYLEPVLKKHLIQFVRALPAKSLLFFTVYDRDSQDEYIDQGLLLREVSQASSVPVYGAWDFQLGQGIVGGKLTSGFYQGEAAAQRLQQIMQGKVPEELPVIEAGANLYMFDHKQLERFGLDRNRIPRDSVLINTPDRRYQLYLVGGTVAMGVLLTIVFVLTQNIHRRKLAEIELREAQQHLEHQVDQRTRQLKVANRQLEFENRERRKAEEEIRHLAYYDSLTGLPNRALFRDRLDQALARAQRDRSKLAVLFFDLDRFKRVNDTLGHSVGDQLLKKVAQRIRSLVRQSDTFARLGGDEFVIILNSLSESRAANIVALKVVEAMEDPITLDDREMTVTTSVGIAIYPRDGEDSETLVSCADMAMYTAKNQGRSAFRSFDPKMLQEKGFVLEDDPSD